MNKPKINRTENEKYLCVKCEKELKKIILGGDAASFFLTSSLAYYCENKECEHFGLITVACIPNVEQN